MDRVYIEKKNVLLIPGQDDPIFLTTMKARLAYYVLESNSPDIEIVLRARKMMYPGYPIWVEQKLTIRDIYELGLVNNMCPNPRLPCVSVWDETNNKYIVIYSPAEAEEFPHGFELRLHNPTTDRMQYSIRMLAYTGE